MLLSSRMTRAVRNSIVLTTAALATVGLTGCNTDLTSTVDKSVPVAQAPAGADNSSTTAKAEAAARAAAEAASRASRTSKEPSKPAPGTTGSGATDSGSSSAPSSTAGGAGGASTGDRIYIGSVAGGYQQALAGTGVPLADHTYSFFTGNVPQAHMLTVSAGG